MMVSAIFTCCPVEPRVGANAPAFAEETVAKGVWGRLLGVSSGQPLCARSGGAGIWWRCPWCARKGCAGSARSPCRMEGVPIVQRSMTFEQLARVGKPP